MCKRRSLCLPLCFLFTVLQSFAQKDSSQWENTLSVTQRLMGTENKGSLEDFSGTVSYAFLASEYRAKPWLKIGTRINALWHYGVPNIDKRDPITNSGPIFEGNLWNARNMSGHSEFELAAIYADFTWAENQLTIGRFLKETPLVNPEVWPLSNALEGIWYKRETSPEGQFQFVLISRMATRFSGEFTGIGSSLGVGGIGVGFDGQPSGYRDNTFGDYIAITNYQKDFSERVSLDIWNYYAENITNTVFIEANFSFPAQSVNLGFMSIYQSKVGNGGNEDPQLAYQRDNQALHFGFRAEKKVGQNLFQVNLSRITNAGRLLLPREWGLEPFYTFQRRTRVEGHANVSSIMVKWQRSWSSSSGNWSVYSSIGRNRMPDVSDFAQNKVTLPTHIHTDISIKYEPQQLVKGLSALFYTAYRFLDEDIDNNPQAIINRADFYHFDFILNYNFNWK